MTNNKQSSVEWLWSFVEPSLTDAQKYFFSMIIEEAKAMHKEEIKEALIDGSMNSTLIEYRIPQYYNETFGGNK
jgi:hypothetical protein